MYKVQVLHLVDIRAAVCRDAQCTRCPAPGPASNPLRQLRGREIQSCLPWRCQYRTPLVFQRLREPLHMLFGYRKAAGEQRSGLPSSPHHLTVYRLHDWANHKAVRRRVQCLERPSSLWDPTGRAQFHNPPSAFTGHTSRGKHLPAVECQLPIHSGRKPDKSKGKSLLVSQIHSQVHISQETSLPEKSLHS